MSKELEALRVLKMLVGKDIKYDISTEYEIIENALKDYEKQDNIINTIKGTIEVNIQEPEMVVEENGGISLSSRVATSLRKQLNEKERKLFREWILKECFPEELKALEIIIDKSVEMSLLKISEDVYAYNCEVQDIYKLTHNEYDLLKKVLL